MRIRNLEEGRVVLSKIEEQVGSEVLCNWAVDACQAYKNDFTKGEGFVEYVVEFIERRYTRHQSNDGTATLFPSLSIR